MPRFLPGILLLLLNLTQALNGASESPSTGESRFSLDGQWHFTIDPETASEKDSGRWDRISVPGNWDMLPAYSKHCGKGWYRRSFKVPEYWKGKRIRLKFDAVNHDAEVSLNGSVVGSHEGGYTPFEFDVTGALDYDGENTITVCADNTTGRGAWWHWGGISRSVSLIANNESRIVWQHIRTEPDLRAGSAKVFVKYKLANAGDRAIKYSLTGSVSPVLTTGIGVSLPVTSVQATIEARSEAFAETSVVIPEARLWHFDHPNLYVLTSRLEADGRTLHLESDRFGVRKIEFKPEGLHLNGELVRVPGFNRVSDSNETGNTEPDSLVRKDVDMMKSAGAVFARLMHHPQAPNLLDCLDEKGMMIFAEIPVWGSDDANVKAGNPLAQQWLAEMIERDYNHPCIIGWSPGNEISNHFDYVRTMIDHVRVKLDPSRAAAYVSNTATRSNATPRNDPVTFGDVAFINVYSREPEIFRKAARILKSRWPDKPVFFSEFGVHQIGASPEATIPGCAAIWDAISSQPQVIGGALWTFNDYRSAYKGTPAAGNREWGVVTVDRRPKAAYGQVRQLFSPVRSLAIANGKIRIEPRAPSEIPSYAMRGYRLVWQAAFSDGTLKSSGEIMLPDLLPGDPAWETILPDESVSKVGVVTPTGFEIASLKR